MRYTTTFTAAVLGVVLTAGITRADPVAWDYSFKVDKTSIWADSPGPEGKITMTLVGGDSTTGDNTIPAVLLTTSSPALPEKPATFTGKGYSLWMDITDTASGKSGSLKFTGEFNGTLSWKKAYLPHKVTSDATQSIVLGDHKYTVSLQVTSPGAPGHLIPGTISSIANVTVSEVPEPSAMILGGLGLGVLGLRTWWQRRRRQRSALALA